MMAHSTQVLITLDLDQLGQLIEDRVAKVFKDLGPNSTEKAVVSELPELATPKQVCKCLQITRPTLHNWGKDTPDRPAILVPQKIGRRVLYRRQDVLSAAKEHRRFKEN